VALVAIVRGTIRRHALFDPDDRVAVALSGGPDSVALLRVMQQLAVEGACVLAGVVHVHHGLRGDDADRDEAFCRELAGAGAVPIDVHHADVAAAARRERRSIESTARAVRDACFAQSAVRLDATRVATGHTLDDQAETVLLRLLRGAALRGVAGIRPRRGLVVRPLLECRRADVLEYLRELDQPFRVDASNADTAIARNRVRHELLPIVERIAPGGVAALGRFAALARGADATLRDRAIEMSRRIVLSDDAGSVCLDAAPLRVLPEAVAQVVVLTCLERIARPNVLSFRHVDAVLSLARAEADGGHLDLPCVAVDRRAGVLTCSRPTGHDPVSFTAGTADTAIERRLDLPGSVRISPSGPVLTARTADSEEMTVGSDPRIAHLQGSAVRAPFVVRTRRDGDRLRPLGAPGRRKVQDLMVDRKVPRAERDRVPIVVDADGRIVWVAGLAIAHECRVTRPESGMVILELKQ
jgi:tRNA(Ile)-lysidine synthase